MGIVIRSFFPIFQKLFIPASVIGGFIGLLAPHAAKKVVGNGHRVSLLLASLIAAVMLIFADTVARNLFSPIEIPAGIAVSLVGVPYFVYLMWKE